MPVTVSVVIPAYNQKELLSSCISALVKQDFGRENFEIIIADDGSTDGTKEFIENTFPAGNVKIFRQQNLGPAAARNLGIRNSSGNIVAFTDSDCRPARDWLSSALRHFEDNSVAGVEGKTALINPEKSTPFSHFTENVTGGRYLTCNIFYRKAALEKAGGFDERFKLAVREDSDLAFSVLEAGGRIVFSPETVVSHPVSAPDYKRFFKKSKEAYYDALLYKKHPGLYRKALKWYDGWAIPVFHYGYYLSFIFALLAFFSKPAQNLIIPLAMLAVSHFTAIVHACRKKKVTLKYLIVMFFQLFIIPFVRLYWVIKGNLRFKTFVF